MSAAEMLAVSEAASEKPTTAGPPAAEARQNQIDVLLRLLKTGAEEQRQTARDLLRRIAPEVLADLEAASEKPKRGRPRRFAAGLIASLRGLYPKECERTITEAMLVADVIEILKEERPWFFDEARGHFPVTLVSAIGRVEDPESIRSVIREINRRRRMPVKHAIAIVRAMRSVYRPKTNDDLAMAVVGAVNQYLATHPGVTLERIEGALEFARMCVRAQIEEDAEAAQ